MKSLNRGYNHTDYSSLLNEFKNTQKNINHYNNAEQKVNREYKLNSNTEAQKSTGKKDKLLRNNKIMYIYSSDDLILHDRSCSRINKIPSEKINMISGYTDEMKWCEACYRNAVIRKGIKYNGKSLAEYVKFFDCIKASTDDLHKLIVENNALVNLINNNTVLIHVNEDTWKIIHDETGNQLLHNNYVVAEEKNARTIVTGFHIQTVYGSKSFHNFVKVMAVYCWEKHNEAKTKKDEKKEEHEKNKQLDEERKKLKASIAFFKDNINEDYINSEAYIYLNGIFNECQIKEIEKGIHQDLSLRQLLLFAKSEFNNKQMAQIRSGCFLHLGISKVKSYAVTEYSAKQMRRIKVKYLFERLFNIGLSGLLKDIKRLMCLNYKKS